MADGFLADEQPSIELIAGRYLVGKRLGSGAFGTVHRCTDVKNNDQPVALKTLDAAQVPKHLSDAQWKTWRMVHEIELLQALEHPNILRVIDFVQPSWTDQRCHLVTELCRGPDLQVVLSARGAFEFAESAVILRQCVSALCYIHDRGVIHRDVKPANIVLYNALPDVRTSPLHDCQIRLVDFGLARLLPERCLDPSQRASSAILRMATRIRSGAPTGSPGGSRHGGSSQGGSSTHGGSPRGSRSMFGMLTSRVTPLTSRLVGGQATPEEGGSKDSSKHGGS